MYFRTLSRILLHIHRLLSLNTTKKTHYIGNYSIFIIAVLTHSLSEFKLKSGESLSVSPAAAASAHDDDGDDDGSCAPLDDLLR